MEDKYVKLGLAEAFTHCHRYAEACTELSYFLRYAYASLPKNVQLLLFQDMLSAFRLLPEMQTHNAISAASLLHQSAESTLPKQKRVMASIEFKHAKIAFRRRYKARKDVEVSGLAQAPYDVLVHIFTFLDLQSLLSVAFVCSSWNCAARENSLWREQYLRFFGPCHTCGQPQGSHAHGRDQPQDAIVTDVANWKEFFKFACGDRMGRQVKNRFKYSRGYCANCDSVVWLDEPHCSGCPEGQCHQVKSVSSMKVMEYVANDIAGTSSSDGDSIASPFSSYGHIRRTKLNYQKAPLLKDVLLSLSPPHLSNIHTYIDVCVFNLYPRAEIL